MIFVTVGLHTQGFDRLIKEIDVLKGKNVFDDEVILQIGYSNYEPINCEWCQSYSAEEIDEFIKRARIVITHGGPSSFLNVLKYGKVPVVVPRQSKYNEHINDHQVDFVKEIKKRMNNIIVVDEISELEETIKNYNEIIKNCKCGMNSHNIEFCEELGKIVEKLLNN